MRIIERPPLCTFEVLFLNWTTYFSPLYSYSVRGASPAQSGLQLLVAAGLGIVMPVLPPAVQAELPDQESALSTGTWAFVLQPDREKQSIEMSQGRGRYGGLMLED
ncbi:hypothetical protein PG984_013541 [Apiospora sp. TS-2023a]